MMEPDEALEECSPVQWLTDGHALAAVMEVIEGRNRECVSAAIYLTTSRILSNDSKVVICGDVVEFRFNV